MDSIKATHALKFCPRGDGTHPLLYIVIWIDDEDALTLSPGQVVDIRFVCVACGNIHLDEYSLSSKHDVDNLFHEVVLGANLLRGNDGSFAELLFDVPLDDVVLTNAHVHL